MSLRFGLPLVSPSRPAPVPAVPSPGSGERWLRALMAAALLVPAAFLAAAGWQSRQAAERDADQQVLRAVALAGEHAQKVMRTQEQVLQRLADAAVGLRHGATEVPPALTGHVLRIEMSVPELRLLAVLDNEGRPLLASGGLVARNLADREFFRVHRAGGRGLYLSKPEAGLVDDPAPVLVVSTRREAADGRFDGVLLLALPEAVFSGFYGELLPPGAGGSVSLFHRSGMIVSRHPRTTGASGMVAPATGRMMQRVAAGETGGLLDIVSPVDGRERRTAFLAVEGHDLYLSATVSHEAIRRAWYADLMRLAAFTVPTALALAWVAWLALQNTRRESAAHRRWQEEAQRREQAERALRQTQRLEALGHLTGGVAHDVNNLLMVVSNNAHLLRRHVGDAKGERPLQAILRAVDTGARLTRQLLAFSRRQALRPEVIRLQDQWPLLTDLVRHSVPARVALTTDIDPQTPCVEVDPAELELALINLAVNARDAMPDGGRLRMVAGPSAEGPPERGEHPQAGWVRIRVEDSGTGMTPEVLERVFEPFFTTKPPGQGTGLGLSQVFGFCRQAGGGVQVQSTPGQGTTVDLLLPGVLAMPQGGPDTAPPLPRADGRLLLVEDNEEVAGATEPLLASWGYQVRRVPTGEAAWALLQAEPEGFDLVLSDIVMPGELDGLALALRLRDTFPGLPVVLTTGHASETAKVMAEGLPLLQKPWSPQALGDVLAQALQKARQAGA
jgi:signal transduction histidine kinase